MKRTGQLNAEQKELVQSLKEDNKRLYVSSVSYWIFHRWKAEDTVEYTVYSPGSYGG